MTTTQDQSDDRQPLMFDEEANRVFREAAKTAFLKVPELRSVVVVYDYFRNLNDIPEISKGMWLSSDGNTTKSSDSMMGSLGAMVQSTAHILDENFNTYQTLKMS